MNLLRAVDDKDIDLLRERIRIGDDVNQRISDDEIDIPSPLYYVAHIETPGLFDLRKGRRDSILQQMFLELIDAGADVNVTNHNNESMLYLAAKHNNLWQVQRLLERNETDPNIVPTSSRFALESPLSHAMFHGNRAMVDALVSRDATIGWSTVFSGQVHEYWRRKYVEMGSSVSPSGQLSRGQSMVRHVVEAILARGNSIHEADFEVLQSGGINRVDMMIIIRMIAQKDRSLTGDRARDLLFRNRMLVMMAINRYRRCGEQLMSSEMEAELPRFFTELDKHKSVGERSIRNIVSFLG